MFKKCKESSQSEVLALLDWRNTPTEGIGTSPAQRLFVHRYKTLLPTASSLLKSRYNTEGDTRALVGMKQRQQYYYNRNAKPLKTITPGETVRIRLPGQDTWSPGTCTGTLDNRSYMVKVGDTEYRRNRKHIQKTGEPPVPEPQSAVVVPPTPPEDGLAKPSVPSSEPSVTDGDNTGPRRSGRIRQTPVWDKDYKIAPNLPGPQCTLPMYSACI